MILRRDAARSAFKDRVQIELIWPRADALGPGSFFDRIIRGLRLSGVLSEREARGKPQETTLRDAGQDYRVSAIAFNFLRLAAPLFLNRVRSS